MAAFRIYRHPTQGIEAVKLGFSWPAFFFGSMWMLSKRMWAAAVVWYGALFATMLTVGVLSVQPGMKGLAGLLWLSALITVPVFAGFHANNWRRRHLERRGYVAGELFESGSGVAAVVHAVTQTEPGQLAVPGKPALVA